MNRTPSAARRSFARRLARAVVSLLILAILGTVTCALLVRYSPGFGVEESDLDPRLSQATAGAIHARSSAQQDLVPFLRDYALHVAQGDLGISRLFSVPVRDLVRDRAPVTARLMCSGMLLAWLAGFALAFASVWHRNPAIRMAAEIAGGFCLAIPPAVVAIEFYAFRAPLSAAMALAILPRIFGALRELIEDAWRSPALVFARARGLAAPMIVLRYVLAPIAPQMAALLGVSAVLAFGAAIPIEALCDVPGLGQLAWRAALGRDLPVLCALAMLVTFAVALTQTAAEAIAPQVEGAAR